VHTVMNFSPLFIPTPFHRGPGRGQVSIVTRP